jgi:hypothetical protein
VPITERQEGIALAIEAARRPDPRDRLPAKVARAARRLRRQP